MSTYNLLRATVTCPRCGQTSAMAIETFFGYGNLIEYGIGDRVTWHTGKSTKHGGRPTHGNLDGEGYTVCPLCHRDFFLKVHVRSDIIVGVEPDLEKVPYIKDKGKSTISGSS